MAVAGSIVNRLTHHSATLLPTTMCDEFQCIHSALQELHCRAHRLQNCADDDVADAYHSLLKTVEQMFGAEQRLMEKYAFPVRQSHLEQHARVLRGLHCVHAAVLRGATEQGRQIGGYLLMNWLQLHQQTTDTPLMIWADYCDLGLIDAGNPSCGGSATAR